MYTNDAVKHFGSRAEIARILKTRTKSAIYQWGEVVPLFAAHELVAISKGKLKLQLEHYAERRAKSPHAAA